MAIVFTPGANSQSKRESKQEIPECIELHQKAICPLYEATNTILNLIANDKDFCNVNTEKHANNPETEITKPSLR